MPQAPQPRPGSRPTIGQMEAPRTNVPLILSAKRATWRMNDADHGEADAEFQIRRTSILMKDGDTCKGEGCGLFSKKWQEVHHRDDNHQNNTDENLVTLCGFCHSIFHVGRATLDGAILLWMDDVADDLPQGDFNQIVRSLYVGAQSSANVAEPCRMLIAALQQRGAVLVDRIGTCDPADLGDALLRTTQQVYDQRKERLWGIRLMPGPHKMSGNRDLWPDIMSYWTSKVGPYGGLPPKTLPSLFQRVNQIMRKDLVNPHA